MSFKKNTAVTGFTVGLVSATDGSDITTGTPVGYYTLDGGIQTAIGDVTPVHEGNGQWSFDLTAGEMNGDIVGLTFTHASAITAHFTIKTETKLVSELNDIAATAIVSAGAITTLSGAIVNVDLVDTTTTNTDMRGTDNALLSANINLTAGAVDAVTTLTNKTGFSLAATGLDAIVSTATGMVEIAKAIWDRVLTGATHNIADSSGRRVRNLQEFGNYEDNRVWIDTINGSAGTTDYESGTILNKVNSVADSNTLGTSLGLDGRGIAPGSSITFIASQDGQDWKGNIWTLALGGQSISNTHIFGADVSGVCTGVSEPEFHECFVGNITPPPCIFKESNMEGKITLPVGVIHLHKCSGESNFILDYGVAVANTEVHLSGFSGDLVVDNLGQNGIDVLDIRGHGKITFNASCVGGTVNWDGHFTIVNNGSGITFNSDDISTNVGLVLEDTGTNLPALIDDLAIKKNTAGLLHVEMVLTSDHVTPATGLTVTAQRLIDGGIYAAVAGTMTEISNGTYRFDYLAADSNGDMITWKFSTATADDTKVTFKTVT